MAFKLPLLVLAALGLSSCGGGPEAFCKASQPIFLKGDDVLSDSTMQEFITNEDARQELCGRFDGHDLFDLGLSKAELTPR
ncbi:MAG: hypothetical protein WCO00_01670 [Rhodospirillaceae bacterium]